MARALPVAVLVAAGVALVAVTHRPALRDDHVVAWADMPASRAVLVGSATTTTTRACAAGALSVTAGNAGAWHGQAVQELLITNTSSATCSVSGFPAVAGLDRAGRVHPLPVPQQRTARAVNIAAGRTVTATVGAAATCPGAGSSLEDVVYTTLSVTVPGVGRFTVPGTDLNIVCGGLTVTGFTPDQAPEQAPSGRYAGLAASVALPSTVSAGSMLRYTVTLANHGRSAVTFTTCPVYDQRLRAGAAVSGGSYVLNCHAGSQVPGGGHVTYQMQLAVPAGAVKGVAKFGWLLDGGVGAGGTVVVT